MLQGSYRILVLDPEVVLDALFENDNGVRILFGSARRTLIRRFKPCEDALGVKCMSA